MEGPSSLTKQFLCFFAGLVIGIFAITWTIPPRKTELMEMMDVNGNVRVTSNLTKTIVASTTSDPVQSKICTLGNITINKENLAEFYDEFYKYYALNNEW